MGKKNSNKFKSDTGTSSSPAPKRARPEADADESIIFLASTPTVKKSKKNNGDGIQILTETVNSVSVKEKNKKTSASTEIKPAKELPTLTESAKKKKNKKKSKVDETLKETPKPVKRDPWALIENGEATAARSELFEREKEVIPEWKKTAVPPGQRYTDQIKKKWARSDGSMADFSRPEGSLKEDNLGMPGWVSDRLPKTNKKNKSSVPFNVFPNSNKSENKKHNGELKKTGQNEKGRKRPHPEENELVYIVDETEDAAEDAAKREIAAGVKMAKLFDNEDVDDFAGLESDEEIDDEEDGEDMDLLRQVMAVGSDEDEVSDEDEDEEIDEQEDEDEEYEEEEETDTSVLKITPEEVERIVELNEDDGIESSDEEDGEDEDDYEEVTDEDASEEGDEVSDGDEEEEEDSDVSSVASEDSVEAANIGEQREAGKIIADKKSNSVEHDFSKFPFTDEDSAVTATRAFGWIVNSCDTQTFFDEFYQSNSLAIKRKNSKYYGNLFSVAQFTELLGKEHLEYGVNINIAEYRKGVRYTMNGKGKVYPGHLVEHLKAGRSVQFVNPQTFSDNIWYLCEVLQELFGCFVGANTYLTPAGSAGFAPHWDEIDAFLLQLEGKKYWKVYAPENDDGELPRESSGNFTDDDMKDRKPCFEGWIEAGDMLYIPRGFIHQASTAEHDSFHVTISTGRRWAYADMIEKMMPVVLEQLSCSRLKIRQSLPVGMLDIAGVAEVDYKLMEKAPEKLDMPLDRHMSALRKAMSTVVDASVDVMAREFMKQALPPMLTPEEKKLSVLGVTNVLKSKRVIFTAKSKVKLIRRHAQRLIFENEDSCFITHRMANSRLYEGRPEQQFDLPSELIDAFSHLQSSYPEWTSLEELPAEKPVHAVQLAQLLYTHGLIMLKN